MNKPRIFRKRYIPDEIVDISGDELLFRDKNLIITKWKTIKPRPDFAWGISYTFLNEGYKISRFYDANDTFLYWYCDILEIEYYEDKDEYILNDLLLDVKIMPSGKVILLDADELSDATENRMITEKQLVKSLRALGNLFDLLNNDRFPPAICEEGNLYKYSDGK